MQFFGSTSISSIKTDIIVSCVRLMTMAAVVFVVQTSDATTVDPIICAGIAVLIRPYTCAKRRFDIRLT